VAAAAALFVGAVFIWTDYLWYQSLGQGSVFWGRFASQTSVWLACTAVGFAVTFASARAAWKTVAEKPRFNGLTALACFVLAGAMSWQMSQQWMVFRLAVAQSPFGITDPQFGVDVGFFVFTLPAIELLNRWFVGLCILAMVVTVAIVFVSTRLETTGSLNVDWTRLKRTLSILTGLLVLTVAANYWISIWRLDFSLSETPYAGASYADVHAQLPAYWILIAVSLVTAIILFATANTRKWKSVGLAFVALVLLNVLLGNVWPMLVQTYVASPNEATLEAPYIERTISMTRNAYDLSSVVGTPYPALKTIDASASAAAAEQLSDTTIWTPSAVGQAFTQLNRSARTTS
jgi:uncharacterized membrane protein (UPF0182 family)